MSAQPEDKPDTDRLIGLAAELANENERLRGVLGSLLNEKGSVQYPAQHERVIAARKALEVVAVPLSDVTNEMRRAAWEKFTSADVPYSAIYAVMSAVRPELGLCPKCGYNEYASYPTGAAPAEGPTPRTDLEQFDPLSLNGHQPLVVWAKFARQLERESDQFRRNYDAALIQLGAVSTRALSGGDEPLRELCFNYRNTTSMDAEAEFQKIVAFYKAGPVSTSKNIPQECRDILIDVHDTLLTIPENDIGRSLRESLYRLRGTIRTWLASTTSATTLRQP